ncbi:formyltransferase family protein [Vibrio coralliilyticus]|jgi:methionyl-tRNA formyltransferase|uniref:formyltransferase family protein n=1 Tax=Vibrio coralliilyticus TaxID=190893 RepID=UPI00148B66F4|nr:formyltransferase family protein [Vibrio coralliilyticus]NOI30713.1 hypothetical protein [Vibrio coralliilyticus]NOI49739.1 hypothetical protein [Vibrio coralliilyticus]WFB48029.1 formyltransferase family protein [Vibrio coralliilyticus]
MNVIICGNGHGIECIYDGLVNKCKTLILCTETEELISRAKSDGVRTVAHYLEAIENEKDIVLTAAYKPKISEQDLKKARFINIHYALLPRFRGMHAIVWAILNGEKQVGFTVHETAKLLDQGPVVYQESVEIDSNTSWELMEKIDELVKARIGDVLEQYRNYEIQPVAQNDEDAIYVAPRNLTDCEVKWDSWDVTFFKRVKQALVPPYPRPYFIYNDKMVELSSFSVIERDYIEINGHVVYIDDDYVYVKIVGGLLCIEDISIDGEHHKAIEVFKRIGIRFND